MTQTLRLDDLSVLPGQHLSKTALLSTGALHLVLLWLVMQAAPIEQAARQVVQYLKPITLIAAPPPKPKSIVDITPKAIVKPVPEPKVNREITLPSPDVIPLKVVKPLPVIEHPPVPKPLPAPVPVPISEPVPAPKLLPAEPPVIATPEPPPAPLPVPAPAPMPVPVVEPPAPKPLPAPVPEAAPAPAPVPAPAPEPAPMRAAAAEPSPAQALAPVPTAAAVRPSAITPVEAAPAVGAVQTATPSRGGTPTPAAGLNTGKAPGIIYPDMKQWGQPRQRSLAEMANEQLNGARAPRDRLADSVVGAVLPDCVTPNAGGSLLGLITGPYAAATGKCKMPK